MLKTREVSDLDRQLNDARVKLAALTATVIGAIFPIGSIYISTLSTNPATLLGVGTWSAYAAGRVLVGLDSGDANFDTVEETGGAKTVAAAGAVSQPTFTGDALGTHAHELPFQKVDSDTGVLRIIDRDVFGVGTSRAAQSVLAAPTASSTSAEVMLNEAKSAGTPSGTVSQPTFTGSATSVVQPYITVYMWKRTA